jgi:aryl-alcohol dehydrogenase-like predicted oxidoreductase
MDLRTAGDSHLVVSAVGLGCNNFSRTGTATESVAGTRAVLDAALDAGVTFLDTAELYGAGASEDLIGRSIEGRRDRFVIATKFGHRAGGAPGWEGWGPRGSAAYIGRAVEGSLRRLRTDHVDLLQLHTPDPSTPVGETLAALAELVAAGKVRFVGNSNFSADQLPEATSPPSWGCRFATKRSTVAGQERRGGDLPAWESSASASCPSSRSTACSPASTPHLGRGRLTRIKPEVLAAVDWEQLDAYRALCDEAGVSMLQATFAWLLSRPGVCSVIAGATSPDQVRQNAAAGTAALDAEVLARIDALFA